MRGADEPAICGAGLVRGGSGADAQHSQRLPGIHGRTLPSRHEPPRRDAATRLRRMLPDAVVHDPDGLALDDLTRTRSWAELADRATRAGHLFRDTYGIAPGGHAAHDHGQPGRVHRAGHGRADLGDLAHADQLAPHRGGGRVHRRRQRVDARGHRRHLRGHGPGRGRRPTRPGGRSRAGRRAGRVERRAVQPRRRRRRLDALHERHDRAAQGREAGHAVDGGGSGPRRPRRGARPRAGRQGTAPGDRTALPRRAPRVLGDRPAERGAARDHAELGRADRARPDRRAPGAQHPPRTDHVRPAAATARRRPRRVRRLVGRHRAARRRTRVAARQAPHDRLVGSGARGVLGWQRGRGRHPRRLR